MALAAGTIGLYDFEGGLTNDAGGASGTAIGAVSYVATAPWHGSKSVQATTPSLTANNGFSLPSSVLSMPGTVEFTIQTGADVTSNQMVFYLKGVSGERIVCVQVFSGAILVFINENAGTVVSSAVSANTNYYYKVAFDGTQTKVYSGTWTTAGTVTLSLVGTLGIMSFGGTGQPTIAYGLHFNPSAVASFLGVMDWLRVRNVADFSTTVTTDVSGSASGSQFFRRRRSR